ncbi:flagellar biosynthetic protein FliR [Pseudotabrizicola algicola]|uniref:Flagellar biosynthetic protein FliR n=1 Tax=Pseudotabrizicola algicola TaxID=2709381 RepID=A0A6B3RK50_9RHOB|nr:flagellar biosynthetic protein FliR [Pseudotabrizicola algicola]NEX45278.1 flagellar biosynthetic protein FliR [Pseudotabrizicola algicola]
MEGAIFTLPGMDLARLADPAASFFFAMLRIGSFLVASPVFGGRFVPLPIRIVAAVCLTLPVASALGLPDADGLARLSAVPLMLAEIAVGLTAGLVLTILFAAAGLAGDRIANAAGLGFAMQVDPTAGGQSPVVAQIFGLALMFVFLETDGHLVALRILLDSYATYPPGATPALGVLITAGVTAGGTMFALASALMMPVVAGLLVLNLAVGVVTRSAPQLNLFSVGFPLAILAAFVLLWLTTPQMFDGLVGVVEAGAGLIGNMLAPVVTGP